MPFVITGYPRSGHGWLATFLYTGGRVVSHEGALQFLNGSRTTRQAHVAVLRALDGDCSSSWLMYPDLLKLVPRVVIIERPLAEVRESYLRVLPEAEAFLDETLEQLQAGFNEMARHGALVLPYEQAYDLQTVERICGYVGVDFDLTRFALMRNLRVSQDTRRCLHESTTTTS